MLEITHRAMEQMANAMYQEIAATLQRKLGDPDTATLRSYVDRARAYGVTKRTDLIVFAECVWYIDSSGYDMEKVDRLMRSEELSIDHKLIPLRTLSDMLQR